VSGVRTLISSSPSAFDRIHRIFVEQGVDFDQHLPAFGVSDIGRAYASRMRSRRDSTYFAASISAFHRNARHRAAIVFDDHQILRHIDQTAASGSPEFAVFSAVSARPLRAPCVEMKVLQHVETLAEVSR
jgi:hypothetical protein